MPYVLNTTDDQRAMLDAIGAGSLEELFEMIPPSLQLGRPLDIPPALTEMELAQVMGALSEKNLHVENAVSFLGGGSYDHFIPAVVDTIASRGEFYTSYTPYQPEVSQGNLQAMFEYQSLICQLTGMDVSNASLYDGGSATAEAVLMAISATRRSGRVVVAESVHPEYRQVLQTYFANLETELVTIPVTDGIVDPASIEQAVDEETACVLLQSPNFFGCIEEVEEITQIAHKAGALSCSIFDPISLAVLKRPGEMDIDIAVAEGQSLGSPMLYGGPSLGIMTCRESFVRRLPGRISGQTVDRQGNRCWVLTLQTREQHIRREKATSNICTNQGLFALRAAVYLATMGPQGLLETAMLCTRKAHYAADQICQSERFERVFDSPVFKEFVIRDRLGEVAPLLEHAASEHILAGIPLGNWYNQLADCFLVTTTEKRTREEIDRLAKCLDQAPGGSTDHA
jgi:glycine dehydrogenase subunit 1